MSKGYFFVKPSSFFRLGDIDIDGNFEYVPCQDFDVEEPRENFLIFEVEYYDNESGRDYYIVCREKVTGEKFTLDVRNRTNRKTRQIEPTIVLESSHLGLYSRVLPLDSIEDQPSRVSGLWYHFADDDEARIHYCAEMRRMFETARGKKWVYDHSVNGPTRFLNNGMRRTYKKTRNFDFADDEE